MTRDKSTRQPLASHGRTSSRPSNGAAQTADREPKPSARAIQIGRHDHRRIEICLAFGDITQVDARALVLGVFRGVEPSGAALAVNAQLGGALRDFVEHRMISGGLGEVFILPAARSGIRGDLVVFVGLGELGSVGLDSLALSVSNAARALTRCRVEDVATVLFGASSGVRPEQALLALLRGVIESVRDADGAAHLRRLTICESDEGRFAAMLGELRRLAHTDLFDDVEVVLTATTLDRPPVAEGATRPDVPREPVYLWTEFKRSSVGRGGREELVTSFLAPTAKAQVLQASLPVALDELDQRLERACGSTTSLAAFGAWLAKTTLAPAIRKAMEQFHDHHLVVVHDAASARVPWEALVLPSGPPALRRGITRRHRSADLSIARWLQPRRTDRQMTVLMVVDPSGDLPGARKEAERIEAALRAAGIKPTVIAGRSATRAAIGRAIGASGCDIFHYAGHAQFDSRYRERSGLLCADGELLVGADLDRVESLPALAIVNACESGRVRRRGGRLANSSKRIEQKVSLADAFLRNGIANYVGTYWPVGDDAAYEFANGLYPALIAGRTLGEALVQARVAVNAASSPDWADYLHYGSPGFVLTRRTPQAPERTVQLNG